MTLRNPIVFIPGGNPNFQELPAGDTLGGAAAGTNGTNGMNGGAITIAYTFSTTTTDSDPGSGNLRLDNATQNTATHIYADLADANGSDWTSVLDTFDASTNTNKADLRLVKVGDATKFLTFTLTARTTATGYRKFTITNTGSSSSSPFADGDSILLCWNRAGDKGADGAATASDFVKNAQVITSGTATSVTFSSIPGTSKDLELRWRASDTGSVGALEAYISFNGDTTAGNYSTASFIGSGSGTTSATGGSGIKCMLIPGASASPSIGMGVVYINDYAGSSQKLVFVQHCDSTGIIRSTIFIWKSTAAITSITVRAGNTAFVNGSIFSCDLLN